MTNLTEFLEARWNEEQQVAEAAIPEGGSGRWPWTCRHEGMEQPPPSHDLCAWLGGCDEEIDLHDDGGHSVEQAKHIAYWDPARALADIEAKRAILAIHEPFYEHGDDEKKYPLCHRCEDGTQRLVAFPCETTLALVQPHRDHPDFDPTWSVPT